MVIADHSSHFKGKKKHRLANNREHWPLASPIDRLAAQVVDFIILIPLISLAFALLKKEILIAQYLGTNPELNFLRFFYYLVAPILIHILYQTVFLSMVGMTPGKYFFGLNVVHLWNRRTPPILSCFYRSAMWWVDVILVFPLMALFSDCKRRSMHDRLSDTIVIAKPERAADSPGLIETQMARAMLLALVAFFATYALSQSQGLYELAAKQGFLASDWVGGNDTCEQVDQALKAWKSTELNGRRLNAALALFAARAIEGDCLNSEADHYLWLENKSEKNQGIGYLAKAFAQLENVELSESYLDKVCQAEPFSEACEMSRIFTLWSEKKWQEVGEKFALLEDTSSDYVKIWAIRHFFRYGGGEKVLTMIDGLSPNFALADFLGEYRIKALWQMGDHRQAESSFEIYWESRDNSDRLYLANWLCYEEVSGNCEGWRSPSCQVLSESLQKFPNILEEAKVALTHLHSLQCRDKEIRPDEILSREVSSFAESINSKVWNRTEIFENLKSFAKDSERSEVVRFDALARAIRSAETVEQLAEIRPLWEDFGREQGWNWLRLGQELANKYSQAKAFDQALQVAKMALEEDTQSRLSLRQMVELNYLAGKKNDAYDWLKKYRSLENNRQPASQSFWNKVDHSLEREFGGK